MSEDNKTPEVIFNTHKFIYSLFHEGKIQGHIIEYENRDGNLEKGEIDSIEIGPSPISARFHFVEGKKVSIPFFRIKKVFFQGELVWDMSDEKTTNSKVIKGF